MAKNYRDKMTQETFALRDLEEVRQFLLNIKKTKLAKSCNEALKKIQCLSAAKIFIRNPIVFSREFKSFSGMKTCLSKSIQALNFWFFCCKAKELCQSTAITKTETLLFPDFRISHAIELMVFPVVKTSSTIRTCLFSIFLLMEKRFSVSVLCCLSNFA